MMKKSASCLSAIASLVLVCFWLFSQWQSHVEDGAIALITQGNALIKAGDPASLQKATETFRKAAETFHGLSTRKEAHNEGNTYYNLARAYHALKQDNQAIEAGQRALPLLTDADARGDQADMYSNLGLYYIDTDQSEKALDAYTHALALYQATGQSDKALKMASVEGAVREDQVTEAAQKKDWTAARDACIQAQQLYHQANEPASEADAWHKLSLIYTELKDAPRAAQARGQEQALRPPSGSTPHK